MTDEQKDLFWGSIVSGIMAIFAGCAALMLIYCWKKGVAIAANKYGNYKLYSRDLQPFGYWCIMLFYLLAFLFGSSLTCFGILKLLPILQKQLANH